MELPKRIDKPWGHEIWWALTEHYAGKVLHVEAGHRLSLQYHERKDETVYLLRGDMRYWVKRAEGAGERAPDASGLEDVHLTAGEAFRITPFTVHYMEAITDCDILEASTPDLDDVVRIKDRYGREGTSAP